MLEKLTALYGEQKATDCHAKIEQLIADFKSRAAKKRSPSLSEQDVIVITYGDQFRGQGKAPLKNLGRFAAKYLSDIASTIHILPFFPYSSDDGFSVIDYTQVDPALGDWEDIKSLGADFKLMFDLVCNHISAKSRWFAGYLAGEEGYRNFFIEMDPNTDLSLVTRPRTTPLLTAFDTAKGTKYLWTTFSEDQVDLNYKSEALLLKIIEVLLFYAEMGADLIRLDAVGFLWKEPGTSCIHLEQTHLIIQLLKEVLDEAAPGVMLVTETNVPHRDNISYFGDGHNEARMVYQFPLPPIMLYTLLEQDATALTQWASSLKAVSDETTYLNFLASHDGIGINPAREILREEDINRMAQAVLKRGGFVSYKKNTDGSESPYEFNISYFDALSDADDPEELKIKRFLVAHAIALSLMGVPGLYIHSLLGSQNYHKGVEQTGRYRMINREKFEMATIEQALDDPSHLRSRVFRSLGSLLKARRRLKAFHPNAQQTILKVDSRVFALVRTSVDGQETVLGLHNISGETVSLKLNLQEHQLTAPRAEDVANGHPVELLDQALQLTLAPYAFAWVRLYP